MLFKIRREFRRTVEYCRIMKYLIKYTINKNKKEREAKKYWKQYISTQSKYYLVYTNMVHDEIDVIDASIKRYKDFLKNI